MELFCSFELHELNLTTSHSIGLAHLKDYLLAAQSGIWPMYRYNPALIDQGQNPLTIDSKEPTVSVQEYAYNETRYRTLIQTDEARAEALMLQAKEDVTRRWEYYRQLAAMHYKPDEQA